MDWHRKMAEELHLEYLKDCSGFVDIVSKALRSTAYKSEKDGWNKAINEAAHYACDAVHHVSCKPLSMEKKGHYIAKHIRRLIREDGK